MFVFLGISVYFCHFLFKSVYFRTVFEKGNKRNPGHTLSVPKSARPGSSRGGGG